MIRGRKNLLPASALEMGLGMLFVLNNKASVARHADGKTDFTLLEQDQPMAEEEEEGERVGREEEGLQWEGQREERWAGTRGGFIN